jgi:NADPH-dependent F420 reductase
MKIAIVGSGHIGAGLARPWTKKGHSVTFAAREPNDAELAALAKEVGAKTASVSDAARGADVVVLAMPYGALDDVLEAAGDLAGKVVVDCTNAVELGPGGMGLKYGHTTSAAEELQKRLPRAKVFKSFNAQGAENLANPIYGGVAASNFFCGDDADARRAVKTLVEDIGFEAIDAGPLKNARLVEPLMLLWMASSQALGTRDVAFKVLRR